MHTSPAESQGGKEPLKFISASCNYHPALIIPHLSCASPDLSHTLTAFKDVRLHTRGSHQNHVTCGDVHVGVGGLLAPGGDAAPGRGADGRTGIAELGGDAVDPGGEGLRALAGGLDGHALPAQLLQERQAALACC